jgi:hypothetical protein
MAWDLLGPRRPLAPSAPAMATTHHALPLNPFKMHSLLLALSEPMLLDSTLPMPTLMMQANQPPQRAYDETPGSDLVEILAA